MTDSDLNRLADSDPSWDTAKYIAGTRLRLTSQTWQLIKSSWYGQTEPMDFYKTISFSHLDPRCLLHAAEMSNAEFERDLLTLERAIGFLGVRYCSVILAINVACKMILKTGPENYWEPMFKKMITSIEIGSRVGAKCKDLGIEGGALIGFARYLGPALLLAQDIKKYRQLSSHAKNDSLESGQTQLYGCTDYQVAAFGLLRLGFGPEISLGAALGIGELSPKYNQYTRETLKWRAAVMWIDSLEAGGNYPKESTFSHFFPELIPPKNNQSNLNFENLMEEVAEIRSSGSSWTWHLPETTYEETSALIAKRVPTR